MFIFSYLLGIYLNRRYGNYGHFFIDDIHLKSLFENNQRRLHTKYFRFSVAHASVLGG